MEHLDWPFLEDGHRDFARELSAWAVASLPAIDHDDLDSTCRRLVRALGDDGWLRHAVVAPWGVSERLDVRTLCLARETLARRAALADFAFAMQGLGSGPVSLFGDEEQRRRYLPGVASGELIAAFAISEPDAGSDVAAMTTTARADGDSFVLDGTKTWISNGGIADFYVLFARTGEAPGAKGLSAFVVEAGDPGLVIAERIEVGAPHPLARLELQGCRVPAARRIGKGGDGFGIAMATLDVFRSTVAAAALGMARRAFQEALDHAAGRRMFGQTLADLQLTQARLADMATGIDAASLLTYRAAWAKDRGAARVTREAAMAKLFATETAQEVIDGAVQLLGALGVVRDSTIEGLYREIRPLRIYEGASEVQKLVIARELLKQHANDRNRAG
jgi:acyl-CoA dehydrogenase